jgi:hypothetical protein
VGQAKHGEIAVIQGEDGVDALAVGEVHEGGIRELNPEVPIPGKIAAMPGKSDSPRRRRSKSRLSNELRNFATAAG